MIILQLQVPEPVAAEYYQAAEKLNERFALKNGAKVDGKSLMAFALAGHTADEIGNQFELALRIATGRDEFGQLEVS